MTRRYFLTLLLLMLSAAGCQPAPKAAPAQGLNILATTSILADIARNVSGSAASVESLLPLGVDPHEYQASPADVQKLSRSTVLIVNGLDYERFLAPLLENAGGTRLTITATQGLEPMLFKSESGQTASDPHMWLDPRRVVRYVENIRDGLAAADPGNAAVYQGNAERYIQQIHDLDAWITEQVGTIPAERRLLVTNHASMGYFADHYGFTLAARIIPSLSSEAGTSAKDLAAAIDAIKASQAPAIFLGKLENAKLAEQIAAETGAVVVDDLYLESLSDGPPAATYLDMMRHNVERIVQALR